MDVGSVGRCKRCSRFGDQAFAIDRRAVADRGKIERLPRIRRARKRSGDGAEQPTVRRAVEIDRKVRLVARPAAGRDARAFAGCSHDGSPVGWSNRGRVARPSKLIGHLVDKGLVFLAFDSPRIATILVCSPIQRAVRCIMHLGAAFRRNRNERGAVPCIFELVVLDIPRRLCGREQIIDRRAVGESIRLVRNDDRLAIVADAADDRESRRVAGRHRPARHLRALGCIVDEGLPIGGRGCRGAARPRELVAHRIDELFRSLRIGSRGIRFVFIACPIQRIVGLVRSGCASARRHRRQIAPRKRVVLDIPRRLCGREQIIDRRAVGETVRLVHDDGRRTVHAEPVHDRQRCGSRNLFVCRSRNPRALGKGASRHCSHAQRQSQNHSPEPHQDGLIRANRRRSRISGSIHCLPSVATNTEKRRQHRFCGLSTATRFGSAWQAEAALRRPGCACSNSLHAQTRFPTSVLTERISIRVTVAVPRGNLTRLPSIETSSFVRQIIH